ncbi:unnamed protein product [Boreogadus saida]
MGPDSQRPALALDNFLASRPAELFLQDVYGLNLGRAPPRPDAPPPKGSGGGGGGGGGGGAPDPVSVGLVERLCRLGVRPGCSRAPSAPPPHPLSFVVAAGGGQPAGRLRRNQSLPS